MAAKKSSVLRGAALVKKAIEASGSVIASPEPVPPGVLKKLRLPNDEKLSPGLKTFLAHDCSYLGWSIDDEDPELEAMSLDELVAQEFGDEHVAAFGEACELLSGDCVLFEGGDVVRSFLYVGEPDDQGEYSIVSLEQEGESEGKAHVFGFAPFDVWIAQRMGALALGEGRGAVPEEYVAVTQALAEANGDGRRAFESQRREIAKEEEEEEDDE